MNATSEMTCLVCADGTARPSLPFLVREIPEDTLFRGLHLWACDACRAHFAVPRPSTTALSDYYAQTYRADGRNVAALDGFPASNPWGLSRGLAIAGLVREAHGGDPGQRTGEGRPLRALEIGAGYGHPLFALRRVLGAHGVPLHVTAVEPDPACQATLSTVADAIFTDAETAFGAAEAASEPFDITLMLHVLEHMEDPCGFLTRLRGVMAPGGILILEVPHCPVKRMRWYPFHTPHLFFFTPEGLGRVLARSGFVVDWVDTYGPHYDDGGEFDTSFVNAPTDFAEPLARGEVPPVPYPIFAESGPNRCFLRAVVRVPAASLG